jgi:hypothetical protein
MIERNPVSSYQSTPLTQEQKALLFLGSTLVSPLGWSARGAGFAWKLWKSRQLILGVSLISSGGGGPGESLTSTDSPPALHQRGQPVPVVVPAASNSAHGGRRSGSKPRSRCPPGYTWSKTKRKCVRVWSFPGGREY